MKNNKQDTKKIRQLSPLTLAYMGDAVYELKIREMIISKGKLTAGKLHKKAIKYVCAQGQAFAALSLKKTLTEDEEYIFKRGRNAWSPTVPKNCSVREYRQATALETLIGYLHLTGNNQRAFELIEFCVEKIDSKGN